MPTEISNRQEFYGRNIIETERLEIFNNEFIILTTLSKTLK